MFEFSQPVLDCVGELTRVCCFCKRERTTDDEWREHVPRCGEQLTHGICPVCLYEFYPEVASRVLARPARR
jgi:hypothetical protein